MGHLDNSASTIDVGRKVVAVAGTAEQLTTDTGRCIAVAIQAETDNTNPVTVGDADVVGALSTRKGIALSAGDTVTLNVDQASKIYLDCITNGEGVTFLLLRP